MEREDKADAILSGIADNPCMLSIVSSTKQAANVNHS